MVVMLAGNLSGTGGQGVLAELNGNGGIVVECTRAMPNTKGGFIVGSDAAEELPELAEARHLAVKQCVNGAANVEGGAMWMLKVDHSGVKVCEGSQ